MSVLSTDWLRAIPFAVLGVSLLGSGHCVAMCGGLILSSAKTPTETALYHLGRLLGYTALGSLAGLLGATVLSSQSFAFLPWLATFFISASFILMGIKTWTGKPIHLFQIPTSYFSKFSRVFGYSAFSTGLLSAALPCGWLHGFVLGAVAMQSASLGALYLFFFWIGTLPALSLAPISIQKIFKPIAARAPKLSAVLLMSVGLLSLAMKLMPPTAQGESCPMHHSESMHP